MSPIVQSRSCGTMARTTEVRDVKQVDMHLQPFHKPARSPVWAAATYKAFVPKRVRAIKRSRIAWDIVFACQSATPAKRQTGIADRIECSLPLRYFEAE